MDKGNKERTRKIIQNSCDYERKVLIICSSTSMYVYGLCMHAQIIWIYVRIYLSIYGYTVCMDIFIYVWIYACMYEYVYSCILTLLSAF